MCTNPIRFTTEKDMRPFFVLAITEPIFFSFTKVYMSGVIFNSKSTRFFVQDQVFFRLYRDFIVTQLVLT